MIPPRPLPSPLDVNPFDRAAAAAAGLTDGRLRRADIVHPYRGVLSTAAPSSAFERCTAYAVRMQPGEAFSHATAAQLLGFPLPIAAQGDERVHVSAVHPSGIPVLKGVKGHRLRVPPEIVELDGLMVCAPADVWVQLGPRLTADDLTVIVDHWFTVTRLDPAGARSAFWNALLRGKRPNASRLRFALERSRPGCASPGETRVRLALVDGGASTAELNAPVTDRVGKVLGHGDLVWRRQRVVVEYEGDYHRVDKEQFRYDIERYERFKEAGWTVIRVTADDLYGERRAALVARVRRALGE